MELKVFVRQPTFSTRALMNFTPPTMLHKGVSREFSLCSFLRSKTNQIYLDIGSYTCFQHDSILRGLMMHWLVVMHWLVDFVLAHVPRGKFGKRCFLEQVLLIGHACHERSYFR